VRSLALLGLVVGLLVVTAVVSPFATWAVTALVGRPFTFSRVYNRVFEVLLVVALVGLWRRLELGRPADIGLARRGWARELWIGLGVGLAGIAVALGLCAVAGALVPDLRYPPLKTLRKALLGAGAAGLIGIGEEALFRGVLLRRLGRDFGTAVGAIATTAIYAAVHALGHAKWRGPVDAWSGVAHTVALFAPLASAGPELIGLALLGALLAAVRLRSGSLWTAIGIHAAWVAAFRIGRLFFVIRLRPAWLVGSGWPPLVGGMAAWMGLAVMAVLILRRRRKAA
jgi:membrane protease YdiL (CAAX protease family)